MRTAAAHRSRPAAAYRAATPRPGKVIFAAAFPAATRLVTNDYAYFNPERPSAHRSPDWIVTSGSLFSHDGAGWTGRPDSARPNITSSSGTGSATFRLLTRRRDFGNVAISFDLLLQRMVSTRRNPAHRWDGVHVFLDYHSQHALYVLTVARRDGVVVAKKKTPGGPANGGTYHTLGTAGRLPPQFGRWEHVLVTISARRGGSVTLAAYIDGRRLLAATDGAAGARRVALRGAVGIRGDNTEFEFAHFRVHRASR